MGTNPNLACGAGAWPPDMNSDGTVNILDVSAMFPGWFHTVLAPPAADPNRRYDLNADGVVNVLDMSEMFPFWLKSCV